MKYISMITDRLRSVPQETLRYELDSLIRTTVGTLLTCLAIVALTMPYKFAGAGVTGIGLISSYMFGISPVWVMTVLNALLLVWGWRCLSLRFALWTLYSTVLTSLVFPLLEMIDYPVIDEPVLAALLGGIVGGLGFGMLFCADASSGGMDIVSAAAKKKWGIDVGVVSLYVNMAILLCSFAAVSFDSILFGALQLYVETLMIDRVLGSFNRRTQALIISSRHNEIADFVMKELERSATIIPTRGAYRRQEFEMLLIVLPRRQVPHLKRFIAQNDPNAFVIFSDVSEVVGEGFRSWLRA